MVLREVKPQLAVHPPDALVVPAVALCAQAVVTLPEGPALFLDHDRLQGRDHLGIAHHAIVARLAVRRPR